MVKIVSYSRRHVRYHRSLRPGHLRSYRRTGEAATRPEHQFVRVCTPYSNPKLARPGQVVDIDGGYTEDSCTWQQGCLLGSQA